MRDFRSAAWELQDEMVARRRDIHQHPETAFQEVRTGGIVLQELNQLEIEAQSGVGKTGVVGVLEGAHEGPTVLVRCDMDALPLQEENTHVYRSKIQGKMHACGHDVHTTVALGVAKLLQEHRDDMHGCVKFIFQPAEELGLGAQAMIDDGALDAPTPDVAFGLHVWPLLPVGEVIISGGPFMASAGLFDITLHGTGGHGAAPHDADDVVVAAAQLTLALQTIISRDISSMENAVLSVTQIHTGEADNVIPESAKLGGSFRTFTPTAYKRITQRLHDLTQGTAQAMNCSAEVNIHESVPTLVNDPDVAQRLRERYRTHMPQLTIHDDVRLMFSEDMGIFLQQVPGVYMFLGAGDSNPEKRFPLHHSRFDVDEEALVMGAALLAAAVSDYVLP